MSYGFIMVWESAPQQKQSLPRLCCCMRLCPPPHNTFKPCKLQIDVPPPGHGGRRWSHPEKGRSQISCTRVKHICDQRFGSRWTACHRKLTRHLSGGNKTDCHVTAPIDRLRSAPNPATKAPHHSDSSFKNVRFYADPATQAHASLPQSVFHDVAA